MPIVSRFEGSSLKDSQKKQERGAAKTIKDRSANQTVALQCVDLFHQNGRGTLQCVDLFHQAWHLSVESSPFGVAFSEGPPWKQ